MPLFKKHRINRVRKALFGFRWRLNLVFGGFLILVVIANISGNMLTQSEMLEDRLDNRIREMSSLMTEIAASYIFAQQLDELEIFSEDINAQDDILDVMFVDPNGILLASGKPRLETFLFDHWTDPVFRKALAKEKTVRERDGLVEKVGVPVRFNNAIHGILRFDVSRAAYKQELSTVARNNFYVGLVIVLIALIICNLLAQHLTRPLKMLIDFTKRVSDGHLDGKVKVRSNDEVELLGHAFNEMVSKLSVTLDEVHQLAFRDKLTGLRNRAWFNNYIDRFFLEASAEKQGRATLFLLDLDRFKSINDTYGHHVGDQVLIRVAARLKHVIIGHHPVPLESSDDFNNLPFKSSITRLGGDEFIMFLPEMKSKAAINDLAKIIIDAFRDPIEFGGVRHSVTVSLGVATFDHGASSYEALFKMADIAMYQAKAHGKNNYQFFNSKLAEEEAERVRTEAELRTAIAEKQFVAHFQPQVNIDTGKIVGAEALIRWNHPRRGLLTPFAFLSIAIEANLIVEIGRCMFRTAIETASQWPKQEGTPVRLNVNACMVELEQADFAQYLLSLLDEFDFPPEQLELEITEDTLMQNEEVVEQHIRLLEQQGISIAVDDFGVGYSNLARLRRLRFDTLKIDRSLVQGLGCDADAENLLRSILSMADTLNLQVVAEGVETMEQLEYLHQQKCPVVQGYIYSAPLDPKIFAQLVEDAPLKLLTDRVNLASETRVTPAA